MFFFFFSLFNGFNEFILIIDWDNLIFIIYLSNNITSYNYIPSIYGELKDISTQIISNMEIKINKTPLNGICKAIKQVNQNNNNIGYFIWDIESL